MKSDFWLINASKKLKQAGIGTSRLDALVLVEDVSGKERGWLLAHPEFELSQAQVTKLEKLLKRRAGHEPLAYIRGRSEFYGREFVLTPAVLEPRPESETMIDLLKQLPHPRHPELPLSDPKLTLRSPLSKKSTLLYIADVGAGTGALGITAQLELPNVQVELLEIDEKALEVTKMNVDKLTSDVITLRSDLLAASSSNYDILLCNLPYVPDDHQINQAALHEPKLAIFGGPDGLDLYRKLFDQVDKLKNKPLYILSESLPPQHTTLVSIAKQHGYQEFQEEDFIQVFKHDK